MVQSLVQKLLLEEKKSHLFGQVNKSDPFQSHYFVGYLMSYTCDSVDISSVFSPTSAADDLGSP